MKKKREKENGRAVNYLGNDKIKGNTKGKDIQKRTPNRKKKTSKVTSAFLNVTVNKDM